MMLRTTMFAAALLGMFAGCGGPKRAPPRGRWRGGPSGRQPDRRLRRRAAIGLGHVRRERREPPPTRPPRGRRGCRGDGRDRRPQSPPLRRNGAAPSGRGEANGQLSSASEIVPGGGQFGPLAPLFCPFQRREMPGQSRMWELPSEGYMALPMPMAPLMFAELTPFVTQSWSWVVGLNVSAASDCSPTGNAGSSVLMVKVAGAVNPAGTLLATSVRVMLATTVPCSWTAASAPVVS